MTEREPFRKSKHHHVIELVGKTTEPRLYSVKTREGASRHFFVEVTTTQNVRHGVAKDIEEWCRQHYDTLPKDGKRIAVNLDEIKKS